MIGIEYTFDHRKPAPGGRGFQYEVTFWDVFRKKGEHITILLPHYADGKRFWVAFGHIDWGKFKTREACADVVMLKWVLDPETERTLAAFSLKTQYDITGVTSKVAQDIYRTLVEEGGASEKPFQQDHFTQNLKQLHAGEYRFDNWIPGGKLFWDRHSIWLGGDPALETPMSRNMEARANFRIQQILTASYETLP